MTSDPSKAGTGKGRKSAARTIARQQGDTELADRLAPPSERKLRDDERCGALTQNKTPCRSSKGARTDHPGYGNCAKHGGNTEAGIKSAMREMGRDLINTYKQDHLRFGGDRRAADFVNLTPEAALLEEVRRSAAMVRFLEEKIATWNLQPHIEDMVERFATSAPRRADEPSLRRHIDEMFKDVQEGDLPELTTRHPNTGIVSFTDAREWLYLYREERGHLARTAKLCIDAGVAQRLVTIAEDQGRILSSAIRAILQCLELTPEQQAKIPIIVPHVLRAVASDQPVPSIPQLLALTSGAA